MSVSGEFRRVLAECAMLLHGSQGEAAPFGDALTRAQRVARNDLEGAADQVLRLLEPDRLDWPFASELEREEFARVADHLRAICHVILGR